MKVPRPLPAQIKFETLILTTVKFDNKIIWVLFSEWVLKASGNVDQ